MRDDPFKFKELVPPLLLACLMLFLVFMASGCMSPPPMAGHTGSALLGPLEQHAGARLGVLSWVGGIALIGGIAALVITRGSIGTRAVLIGIGLVMLNYAVERYADWIFIPVIVATGMCSFVLAYRTVRSAWFKKKGDT